MGLGTFILKLFFLGFLQETLRLMFFVIITILVIYFSETYLTIGTFVIFIIVLSTLIGFIDLVMLTNCSCKNDGSKTKAIEEAEPELYKMLKECEEKTGF